MASITTTLKHFIGKKETLITGKMDTLLIVIAFTKLPEFACWFRGFDGSLRTSLELNKIHLKSNIKGNGEINN